jgi:nucleotide-binding universal stress UspA family protein
VAVRYDLPLVKSVLHPTDFSAESQQAFAHALAIALIRKTSLTLLHAGGDRSRSWESFPSVRGTLERWGMLEPGSHRSAVFDQLSVRVKKVVSKERDPLAACLGYMERHPADLIVLATRGRKGPVNWLKKSVSQSVARHSTAMSLFVPGRGRGFVSLGNGHLDLQRILVPIAHKPSPQPSIEFAARAGRVFGSALEITLLHVGDTNGVPEVSLPDEPNIEWRSEVRQGDPVDQIVAEADRLSANLIVMTTDGRDVLIDALRGSHTERVLRRSSSPVMALPVTWTDEFVQGRHLADVVSEEDRRQRRALKDAFRSAARDLHPDRAVSADRAGRNELMAKANEAYRRKDVAELERLKRRSANSE